jgi:branched-chain amino acid transport system ATP-binding protein
MIEAVLQVTDLAKSFGAFRALDGVSLSVEAGQLVALIGPNGAGKSTCFNAINGQLRPDAGRVVVAGQDVTGLAPHRLWRHGMGRTFQIAATFGSMSVVENVQMALIARHKQTGRLFRPATGLHRASALETLARVGMADQAERPCMVLSYGDIKRVELAIALAGRPRVLLMDEPTAGMASGERAALMEVVTRAAQEESMAVLFTEHDMDVVFGHAHRIFVLHRGRVLAEGAPDAVRQDPRVREVYLGSAAEASA